MRNITLPNRRALLARMEARTQLTDLIFEKLPKVRGSFAAFDIATGKVVSRGQGQRTKLWGGRNFEAVVIDIIKGLRSQILTDAPAQHAQELALIAMHKELRQNERYRTPYAAWKRNLSERAKGRIERYAQEIALNKVISEDEASRLAAEQIAEAIRRFPISQKEWDQEVRISGSQILEWERGVSRRERAKPIENRAHRRRSS